MMQTTFAIFTSIWRFFCVRAGRIRVVDVRTCFRFGFLDHVIKNLNLTNFKLTKFTCSVSDEGSMTSITGDSHFTIFEGPGEELKNGY